VRVLIVGGGAVGQVFGYHLARGGAQVTFFLREKYAEAATQGFTLYALNSRDKTSPHLFDDFDVVTSEAEVRNRQFDQLWLAVSSPALRMGWLTELVDAVGHAAVVSLTDGVHDREFMLEHVQPSRLVSGFIALISYQAPLRNEKRFPVPGVAFWFPPLTSCPFDGPYDECARIVSTLKRGGQPASYAKGRATEGAAPAAMTSPLFMALEGAGWSFRELATGDHLAIGTGAGREAAVLSVRHRGLRPPAIRAVLRPWVVRCVMVIAKWIIPLDIETYLAYHFSKVGQQTRMYIDAYLLLAAETGGSAVALTTLRKRVEK
jgi:hypothetical protein